MTCKELHDYWESDLRVAISLLSDSAELAEHVATCPKCDLFITERKELEKQLHLVSSAGPEIPPSLDNAVLANYRRYMAERPSSAVSNPVILRTNSRTALGWAAAMGIKKRPGHKKSPARRQGLMAIQSNAQIRLHSQNGTTRFRQDFKA